MATGGMRSRRVSLSTYRFQSFASPPNRSRCNPQQSSFFRKPRIQLQLMLSSYFTSIAAGTCVASPSQPPPISISFSRSVFQSNMSHKFIISLWRCRDGGPNPQKQKKNSFDSVGNPRVRHHNRRWPHADWIMLHSAGQFNSEAASIQPK